MFQMVGNKLVIIVRFYHLVVVGWNIESYYITYQDFFLFFGSMHGSMQGTKWQALGSPKGEYT
jgi:hypothetical protein